jgi:hypothetical protein
MSQQLRIIPTAISFFALIIFSISCEKVIDKPVFDVVPSIEILGVSSREIVEFRDSLVVTLAYEDGDGDLGSSDPDFNSIFVHDQRLPRPDEYYLGPLAPEDAKISIRGTLNLVLARTFLLGNGTEEQTIFHIHLIDRAGNKSNTVNTGEIVIRRN